MDYQYALAFAAASDSLCVFTGAGFSKHLSGGACPDWAELLEQCCDYLADPTNAKAQLAQAKASYPLEDCAQILEIAFLRESKDFKSALAELIGNVRVDRAASQATRQFFERNSQVVVVTTNYDRLLEETLEGLPFVSNFPGKPISRKAAAAQIFHIHGSIESPQSIVATTNDYYKFINEQGYFAQKTLTLMHESSVVILGYSLSDPNLKAILSDLRYHGMRSISRGNIFYVTRSVVPAFVRDYYEAAYGLFVLENMTIDAAFASIELRLAEARRDMVTVENDLRDVIAGRKVWLDDYIKLHASLFRILATANMIGLDIRSPEFVEMLSQLLAKKRAFTNVLNAWEQYSHLADWLVHIGSVIDVRGTPLEETYKEAVLHSMRSMTSKYERGKSWYAFSVWNGKWKFISFDNRLLIKEFILANLSHHEDAISVVSQ